MHTRDVHESETGCLVESVFDVLTEDSAACRVMFFLAVPKERATLDALQSEAARFCDMHIEPHISEDYFNVTHQTLDIFRAAIVDPAVTHVLKVLAYSLDWLCTAVICWSVRQHSKT